MMTKTTTKVTAKDDGDVYFAHEDRNDDKDNNITTKTPGADNLDRDN